MFGKITDSEEQQQPRLQSRTIKIFFDIKSQSEEQKDEDDETLVRLGVNVNETVTVSIPARPGHG